MSKAILAPLVTIATLACSSESHEPLPVSNGREPAQFQPGGIYAPEITAADLSAVITNPWFPGPIGARWVYEKHGDLGLERIEIRVEEETRDVWGTSARVIRDTVLLSGELIEDTWDWYGQDPDGNVWYLGEETYEYENGVILCSCGAWEAGEDVASVGAIGLPGVIMLGNPQVGDVYRQEYYAGEAEDLAGVVELDVRVEVPAGSFTGCVKTRDRSVLDLAYDAFKYYCPGVGLVLEEEAGTRTELIEYSGL